MLRKILSFRSLSTRIGSSVAEPHELAASLNRDVHRLWKEGKTEEAIVIQERAIRIKEHRGDEDLEQFREELEALKEGDAY